MAGPVWPQHPRGGPVTKRTADDLRRYNTEYRRKWRASHPGAAKPRREETRDFKALYKAVPCMDCGQTFHPRAMEFDHRPDSGKRFKLSRAISNKDKIVKEIAKCDVVCVLCHRLRSDARMDRKETPSITVVRRRALQDKVNALKTGGCQICKRQYLACQMDFDHLDPAQKVDKIAALVHSRAAWSRISAEIQKCRLLCALCHRLHTVGAL